MYAIFLDGESKTGKTTVGSAIEADLSRDYRVFKAVAGSFYRRLTVAALELHGGSYDKHDMTWLEPSIAEAIASNAAYDEERNWDAIGSKEIDQLVSIAGQLAITQTAGKEWWRITADLAEKQGAEVFVVDGRNPRAKLADWRSEHVMPIALDLCVYCDPLVAAERYVKAYGNTDPTPEDIAKAQVGIETRRHLDRTRTVAPYQESADQIIFDSGVSDATKVVERAFAADVAERPQVIRFDTSHSPLELTQITAGQLSRAALDHLTK